jgi:hypothetical protein
VRSSVCDTRPDFVDLSRDFFDAVPAALFHDHVMLCFVGGAWGHGCVPGVFYTLKLA